MRRRARAGGRSTSAGTARATAPAVATLTAAALAMTGCSRGVEVAPPSGLSPRAQSACRAVTWPKTVARLEQVPTTPESTLTAAWGDPPLIARCGVPAAGPTTDDCVVVDGVDWVIHPLSDGTRLTTFGRDPAIELLVPTDYGPAPLLLPAFDAAARALPRTGHACE